MAQIKAASAKHRTDPAGTADRGRATPTTVKARGLMPALSPAEQRVAQVVIDEAATAAELTITELAKRAGTSETTVIRFCRAMGFTGYPQLRLALATDAGRVPAGGLSRETIGSDISPGAEPSDVVKKIAFADVRAVEETAGQLDLVVLDKVVNAV